MNDIATVAPRKISAIVPQTIAETAQLADLIFKSGTAPKGMNIQAVMIAIMRGCEIGLTPFQALDKIAIVNNRPLLMGEAALALVRSSGKAEYIKEWIDGKDDARIAYCEAKRGKEIITRKFSVADAKKAGLWGKGGPWSQYPERMLGMRARAFCLRDAFPDCLGGLYLREEFEGVDNVSAFEPETPPEPITAEQIIELQELIKETASEEKQFLEYLNTTALTELDSKGYERGKKALLNKKARNNG